MQSQSSYTPQSKEQPIIQEMIPIYEHQAFMKNIQQAHEDLTQFIKLLPQYQNVI